MDISKLAGTLIPVLLPRTATTAVSHDVLRTDGTGIRDLRRNWGIFRRRPGAGRVRFLRQYLYRAFRIVQVRGHD
jgi:hypothetical protein